MDENNMHCCHSSCSACSGCGAEEEYDNILTLTDEEGNDVEFEILDVVVLDDETQYLVVAEVGNDDPEAIILEIREEDGEEVYDIVTDEDIANEVFEIYSSSFDEEE